MSKHVQKETTQHFKPMMDSMTEIVGSVEKVRKDAVVLSLATTRYVVSFKSGELVKWKNQLKVGCRIGILFLDDGTLRIRSME